MTLRILSLTAIASLAACAHLKAPDIPSLIAEGNRAFEAGELEAAERRYREVLRADSAHPEANNNLALVYWKRGTRLWRARRLAESALPQAGPLRPYVLDTLANIEMKLGRPADARKALDEAESNSGDDAALRQRLARSRSVLKIYED